MCFEKATSGSCYTSGMTVSLSGFNEHAIIDYDVLYWHLQSVNGSFDIEQLAGHVVFVSTNIAHYNLARMPLCSNTLK
jgi:hypothetical protein